MAKVSYLQIPSGLEDAYKRGLQSGDRFQFSRIRLKNLFLSRSRVKGITEKSLLVSLAPEWQAFTVPQQAAWTSADNESKMSGWKAFVKDTAARLRAGISGRATPHDLYQALVGRIEIDYPSTGLLIEQAHPSAYFIQRKITGTKSQYSPVEIDEFFTLPLTLGISYKSALTSTGAGARARFYCVVYSSYQGTDIETVVSCDFSLSHDWERKTATLYAVKGKIIGYSAFIEVKDARGNLYFDNVSLFHNSAEWARDPYCNLIEQNFTRAFFQVARHWVAVNPNSGADFGSFYYS